MFDIENCEQIFCFQRSFLLVVQSSWRPNQLKKSENLDRQQRILRDSSICNLSILCSKVHEFNKSERADFRLLHGSEMPVSHQDSLFIGEVEKNSILWNVRLKDYKNKRSKKITFLAIADKLG